MFEGGWFPGHSVGRSSLRGQNTKITFYYSQNKHLRQTTYKSPVTAGSHVMSVSLTFQRYSLLNAVTQSNTWLSTEPKIHHVSQHNL